MIDESQDNNMDLINRFTELLKVIPADEFHEAIVCFETLKIYSVLVVEERLSFLETFHYEEGIPLHDTKFWNKLRSDAHDAAINACSRLNELCQEVNVDKICDFDVTDRKKVAEFCGFVLSTLFYSNINCKDPMASWLSFAVADESDED